MTPRNHAECCTVDAEMYSHRITGYKQKLDDSRIGLLPEI
jgi:hypothetical protein